MRGIRVSPLSKLTQYPLVEPAPATHERSLRVDLRRVPPHPDRWSSSERAAPDSDQIAAGAQTNCSGALSQHERAGLVEEQRCPFIFYRC